MNGWLRRYSNATGSARASTTATGNQMISSRVAISTAIDATTTSASTQSRHTRRGGGGVARGSDNKERKTPVT